MLRPLSLSIAVGLLGLAGFVLEAFDDWSPRELLRSTYYSVVLGTPLIQQVPRHPFACGRIQSDQRMVALAFGQSNAANFGKQRSRAARDVYSFHSGRCYLAQDPMPGADGGGGSVWPRLGDELVRRGVYRSVVFITVGFGGTSVAEWAPGGAHHARLLDAARDARLAGLEITHLLWHQGESDSRLGTGRTTYISQFHALITSIRAEGILAPAYVSLATYCRSNQSFAIRAAQTALLSAELNIRQGPDTDRFLSDVDRYDGCHFSPSGMEKYSDAWADILETQL